MDTRALASALLLVLTACRAPLARTSHQIVEADRFVGAWEVALLGWPAELDDEQEPPRESEPLVLGRLEVEVEAGDSDRGGLVRLLDLFTMRRPGDPEPAPDRLVVQFVWTLGDDDAEAAEAEPQPTRFDAQIIEVAGRRFLTMQRFAGGDRFDPWAAPLQRTFLVDEPESGRRLQLSYHSLGLLWSPIRFAGRFEFDPGVFGPNGGIGLVSRFDDLLEFYAERPGEEWTPVLEVRRVD